MAGGSNSSEHHDDAHAHDHDHVSNHERKEVNVAVVILVGLLLTTIMFNVVRKEVERRTSRNFRPVVEAAFSELMVLGFVAIVLFIVTSMPGIEALSNDIFRNDGEIEHIAHVLHICLFLVMVVFILQVTTYIVVLGQRLDRVRQLEASCWDVLSLVKAFETRRTSKRRRRLRYASFRHQFVSTGTAGERSVDFDFAEYLAVLTGHLTADLVEIPLTTWCSLFVGVGLAWVYLVPLNAKGDEHMGTVLGVQAVLTAIASLLLWHVSFVKNRLEPEVFAPCSSSALLKSSSSAKKKQKWKKRTVDDLAVNEENKSTASSSSARMQKTISALSDASQILVFPQEEVEEVKSTTETSTTETTRRNNKKTTTTPRQMSTYLCRESGEAYAIESSRKAKAIDPKSLFFLHRPELVPWLARTVLLLQAVCVGYAVHRLSHNWHVFWPHTIAMILMPVFVAGYVVPALVFDLVVVTSVEAYKKPLVISQVVRMKKLVRSFRALQLAAIMIKCDDQVTGRLFFRRNSSATSVAFSDDDDLVFVLSPRAYVEQRELFRVFDRDGNGRVSKTEINDFLNKVSRAAQSDVYPVDILSSPGGQEDQEIDFHTFANWILRLQHQHGTNRHIHDMMFHLLDDSHDGVVSLVELADMMDMIGEHFLIDDLQLILTHFDSSGDGKLDRFEFGTLLRSLGIS